METESTELIDARTALHEAILQAKVTEEVSRLKQIEKWKKGMKTKHLPTTQLENALKEASQNTNTNIIEDVTISVFIDLFLEDIQETRENVIKKQKIVDNLIEKASEEKLLNIQKVIPDYVPLLQTATPSEQFQQCVQLLESLVISQRKTEERVESLMISQRKTEERVAELWATQFSLSRARDAGFTCSQARSAGYTCSQAKSAGYTCSQAMSAGFTSVELSNVMRLRCIHTLSGHTGHVSCVSVLPDGRIVSGSNDCTLRIWDASSGRCINTLSGHTNVVNCVSVLPDGRIVSGSNDCTLRIWDASSGRCINTLSGHTNVVNCVSVLPDGRIVSGSNDYTLRIVEEEWI